MNCSTKVSLCQTIFYIKSKQQWFQKKINLTYIRIYKYVSTKIGTIIVCCSTVYFQFDWHLMNRINLDTVSHRITFPPSGLLFYIFDDPGIGLISLSKSAGFGISGIKLPRFGPETNMCFSFFHTQKFLVCHTPPYLFGCIHFRLDLLTGKIFGFYVIIFILTGRQLTVGM